MTKNSHPTPQLTLFDASRFNFEANPDLKAPARPPVAGGFAGRFADAFAGGRPSSNAELATARRRRARARLAKRRYIADREGYERLEQARQALHLVSD